MHPVLQVIDDELVELITALKTSGNIEPLNVATQLWSAPGTTSGELQQVVVCTRTLIAEHGIDDLADGDVLIGDYQRRLVFLRTQTVPQLWGGNAGQAVAAFTITMQGLHEAIKNANPENQALAQAITKATADAKSNTRRLRTLESLITGMEPRSTSLDEMITRIENADAAANRLPTDIESLKEARVTIERLLAAISSDSKKVAELADLAKVDKIALSAHVSVAEDIVNKCSTAYAATTSHGLAAAFAERSTALAKSMWVWVGGLVVALGLGSWIGSTQLHNFSEVLKEPTANPTLAAINLILALLSVSATVWFSWLATKQVGQRFRLAEDYAFKASVSRAYEGYRREAENIDPEFVARLFSSALSRLDEQPLRLVETTAHGSPWHELASSDLIRKAVSSVPEFTASVTRLAKEGLASISPAKKAVGAEKVVSD